MILADNRGSLKMLDWIDEKAGKAFKSVVASEYCDNETWEALKNAALSLGEQAIKVHHAMHGINQPVVMPMHKVLLMMDYVRLLYDHKDDGIESYNPDIAIDLTQSKLKLVDAAIDDAAHLSPFQKNKVIGDCDRLNADYCKLADAVVEISKKPALALSHAINSDDDMETANRIHNDMIDVASHNPIDNSSIHSVEEMKALREKITVGLVAGNDCGPTDDFSPKF